MRIYVLLFSLMVVLTNVQAQSPKEKLTITPLYGDFYVYTTYSVYEENYIPAHGMYLVTENGAVLFDTPWDTTQFQPLLDSIELRHHKHVELCIATHWHSDRTEGLEYYNNQGIRTYTTSLTDKFSIENQKKRAQFLMTKDTLFNIGGYSFEVFYPGEGHTADNIIIWFDHEKILYGGCLIKGVEATDLGYLGDANVAEYESTLRRVQKECPNPKYIIVSHHDWKSTKSLKHSIKLARKLKRKSAH